MSNLKKYKDAKGNSQPYLYRDIKTDVFWAVVRVGDKIKKESLKTTDKLEAFGKVNSVVLDLSKETDQKKRAKAPNKLMSDYWANLITLKKSLETSEATLERMDIVWRLHLEPYFGKFRPEDVTADMMPAFMEWHKKKSPGVQFYNTFKYLSSLLNYMYEVGAIERKQKPRIDLPKSEALHHDKKKGRIISPDMKKSLLENAVNLRIKFLMDLADTIGNRKMEIGGLKKDRLNLEDGRYFIHLEEDDTKTGLPRIIPVPERLNADLEALIEASGDSEYLFPTRDGKKHIPPQMIDRDWGATKRKAKIKGRLRFHDWRGTAATRMAKSNINPIIACTILGMSFSTYQKKYLNLSGKDLMISVDQLSQGDAA